MPSDITVNNDLGICGAEVTWTAPTADDNCAVTSFTSNYASGYEFPVGTTTVTYTAKDAAGNEVSASFDVTVNDTEKPSIAGMPSDITVNNDLGVCGAEVTWTAPTADDNCAVTSFTSNYASGYGFPVGTTTVTYTAKDAAGNEVSASFDVTVNDTEKPSIAGMPSDITVNNDLGVCGAEVTWTAPTADDNCAVTSFTSNYASGYEFPVGTTTVTYTAKDAAGNEVSASFDVTVNDTEVPAITAPGDLTVSADATACSASGVNLGNPASADNCSVASVTNNAPAVFPMGSTTVTWTAKDANGNTATDVQIVTVVDDTAPVLACRDLTVYLSPQGTYVLSQDNIQTISGNVTDNCSSAGQISVSVSPSTFSCSDAGKQVPVVVTATDIYGNTSTCQAKVFVIDYHAPEIICPEDITVSAEQGKCSSIVNFAATTTDNCAASLTYSHQPGSEFPVGSTVVTITAKDASNNRSECSFTITVTDNEAPVIKCIEDIQVAANSGDCGASVPFNVIATDNCSTSPEAVYSHEPGSWFQIGTTEVTVTFTDAAGNSSVCEFNVTVTDEEKPAIVCPEDITVSMDEGTCGATVDFEVAVTDNCNEVPALVYSHEPGSVFPAGLTVVTVTATDAAGNKSECSFNVIVTDNEAPVILCPEDITLTANAGECEANVIVPELQVSDNCGYTVSNDFNSTANASGVYPSGVTTVTWTVTDNGGNSVSCLMTVTVVTPPVAVDDAVTVQENTSAEIDLLANDTDCNNSLDAGTVTIVTAASHGVVTINPENGVATYTPAAGFSGADTFTYSVCNADGLCDEGNVTIQVISVNKAPYALNDINTTFINTPARGWVLTNDIDPDDDELTVSTTLVVTASNGTVTISANGNYTYTPNSGFTGKDSFKYLVCDQSGLCDEAEVFLSVIPRSVKDINRNPVAIEDNYFGKKDVPVFGNLLSNDFDPDGNSITISTSPISGPSIGVLEINTNGTFSYFPSNGYTGVISFVYQICDNGTPSTCSQAVVTIDIREHSGENTTVAVDDAYYIHSGKKLTGKVAHNDYDPEGDNQINFSLLVAPSNGTFSLLPDGTFEYTSIAGFTGSNFFIYEVCDNSESSLSCDWATAYILVEESPVDTIPGPPQEQETFKIPEGFSPNYDGYNDYFEITGLQPYPEAKLEVYSRWGVLLYEKEGYGNTDRWGTADAWWDGTSNKKWTSGSEKLPTGTYFYIFYYNNGESEPKTGSVFLNRNSK
jgi:gliding motility-associated-like protein